MPVHIIVVGILMELCYLSFYAVARGPEEVLLFIGVNVSTFLLLAYLLWRSRREGEPAGKSVTPLLVGFGILFRLTLVPHDAVGSDDIYRYLWDGRVTASGANPYLYPPVDSRLAHLATVDLPSKVNNPELRSVYPALAQALFLVSHRLFGESQAGMKLLLTLIDIATILILYYLLRGRGNPFPLIIYAWSPLPILYFGLDGHIDALGIPFLLLALRFVLTGHAVRAGVAIGLGALGKFIPLISLPFLFRQEKVTRPLWTLAAAVITVGGGTLLYYEPAWGVLDGLLTFGSQWEFNGGVFWLGYLLTGSNVGAHLLSAIEIVLWIGIIALVRKPFLDKIFWGLAGFILLAPVVHPWYLTWLAALLALRWSPAIFLFTGLSGLANIVVYQYRATGVWRDQPLLLLIEYLPVVILLLRETVLQRGPAGTPGPARSSPRGGTPGDDSR